MLICESTYTDVQFSMKMMLLAFCACMRKGGRASCEVLLLVPHFCLPWKQNYSTSYHRVHVWVGSLPFRGLLGAFQGGTHTATRCSA